MADPKKTPAVPTSTKLRIHARTRAGRNLADVAVTLEIGAVAKTGSTGANGFASFAVTGAELDAASPPGAITIRARKHHHGPDLGPGSAVTPGEVSLTANASVRGYDPSTTGVVSDSAGTFLEIVMIDGGMALAAISSKVTRRLDDDELQRELMAHHLSGAITLKADSEFVYEHDLSLGEFAPCDPAKCKVKRPHVDRRVALQSSTIGGVTFFALLNFRPSSAKSSDVIPGQRFTRDAFQWGTMPLQKLDQRHVVGLVRMCNLLSSGHGIVAIYTQGVNGDTSRKDCHGHGLAIDFGGLSKELPDPTAKTMKVRLGVDFIVMLHWGNHPMWNSARVAAAPTTPASWVRLKVNDDDFDYGTDPTGKNNKLHYRLDPPPFQEPVPATATPPPTDADKVAAHFVAARVLFEAVYDFAVQEYSDSNEALGPLPAGKLDTPTPIDSHEGHFVLHPDYPKPNTVSPKDPNVIASDGRQAHVNHLHFQLGPTHYKSERTS